MPLSTCDPLSAFLSLQFFDLQFRRYSLRKRADSLMVTKTAASIPTHVRNPAARVVVRPSGEVVRCAVGPPSWLLAEVGRSGGLFVSVLGAAGVVSCAGFMLPFPPHLLACRHHPVLHRWPHSCCPCCSAQRIMRATEIRFGDAVFPSRGGECMVVEFVLYIASILSQLSQCLLCPPWGCVLWRTFLGGWPCNAHSPLSPQTTFWCINHDACSAHGAQPALPGGQLRQCAHGAGAPHLQAVPPVLCEHCSVSQGP